MKYSLCVEPFLPKLPLGECVRMAKDAGFDAIELWDPARHPKGELEKAASLLPVSCVALVNNWGLRLCEDFHSVQKQVQETLAIGSALGCKRFIGLAGDVGTHGQDQMERLSAHLSELVPLLTDNDAQIVLEGLNSSVDHPGYALDSSAVGLKIAQAIHSPAVKFLYDVYHMQIMEGNLIHTIQKNIQWIGHFHSAGVPGRHELSTGELSYPHIVEAIDKLPYSGYFGLEYWPTLDAQVSMRQQITHLRNEI